MRASDRAYNALRGEILDGSLTPGTVLAEVEQSTRLGISRTPLREALARLAAAGLVSARPGRGLEVTTVSLAGIGELFEVREALEVQAARLAARRRDAAPFRRLQADFLHAADLVDDGDPARRAYYSLIARLDAAIDDATANPVLVATLGGVRTHVARVRRLSADDPDRLRAAAGEHLAIIEGILDGSEAVAAHATSLHLYRSLKSILASADARAPAPAGAPIP